MNPRQSNCVQDPEQSRDALIALVSSTRLLEINTHLGKVCAQQKSGTQVRSIRLCEVKRSRELLKNIHKEDTHNVAWLI